jgi:ABC-type glutathione transport system ATPase component
MGAPGALPQGRGFASDVIRRLLKGTRRSDRLMSSAASTVAKLSAYNLRKKYKSRTVVTDVSFEVAAGEVVGLLGPNGAGKTTCFYMIVGLVAADGGEIIEHGDEHQRLTHMPIHQRAKLGLSYLPQENSVFRKLTVSENVRAVLELQGLDEAADGRAPRRIPAAGTAHHSHRKNLAAIALRRRAPPRRNRPRPGHRARASSCSTNPSPASIRLP